MDSIRLDLPSASSANRRRNCRGSQNLIRELSSRGLLRQQQQSAEAASGSRVHAAWAGQALEKLSASEHQTLVELERLEALVLEDWVGTQIRDVTLLGREQRLWLHDGLDPLLSGQYDCAYSLDSRVLILDAKTLYGQLEGASSNDQLRELVALFHFNYPHFTHYTVALLVPNQAERISIATYDELEAKLALRLTYITLAEGNDPAAPRTPGRWCQVCPAVADCEEARALVGHFNDSLSTRLDRGEFTLPLGERGALLLDQIKIAKSIIKTLEEAYKTELQHAPDSLPGWHLRNGKKIRQIAEVERALEAWKNARLDIADFLFATEISVSRLQERYGLAAGIKGKRLEQEFNERFSELITFKVYAPELERDSKPRALPAS